MALLDKPIEVAFVADDSQIAEVMARIGKQSEKMGSTMRTSSEGARLGMWSLGESAENLAQSLGVPHQMSRQLGNSVERLAGGMGGLAIAFGGVALAAMGAYALWNQYNEQQQKAHEELEKTVDAMLKEETALNKNTAQTNALKEANDRLADVRKRILDQKFDEYVKQETAEIQKLHKELKDGPSLWMQIFIAMEKLAGRGKLLMPQIQKAQQDAALEAQKKQAELNVKILQHKKNNDDILWNLNEEEKKKYHKSWEENDALRQYYFNLDVKRQQDEERTNQLRIQGAQVVAQNFAGTFQMMATLGGKHARQWFTMYKLSAISEAIISTYSGAARALKDYPAPWSYAVAASVIASGLAKVAVIRAQQFGGGGAGGAGAIGTFPANPATGLPAGQGLGQITININGNMVGTYDINQITSGVVRNLYNNNGSVDGFSVAVERSA